MDALRFIKSMWHSIIEGHGELALVIFMALFCGGGTWYLVDTYEEVYFCTEDIKEVEEKLNEGGWSYYEGKSKVGQGVCLSSVVKKAPETKEK